MHMLEGICCGACLRRAVAFFSCSCVRRAQPLRVQHAAAVKSIGWVHDKNALVTGSWDRTMKVWDCRTPTPQASVAISDRCVSMDVGSPVIIMGTGDDKISVYNIGNLSTPYRVRTGTAHVWLTAHCIWMWVCMGVQGCMQSTLRFVCRTRFRDMLFAVVRHAPVRQGSRVCQANALCALVPE